MIINGIFTQYLIFNDMRTQYYTQDQMWYSMTIKALFSNGSMNYLIANIVGTGALLPDQNQQQKAPSIAANFPEMGGIINHTPKSSKIRLCQ